MRTAINIPAIGDALIARCETLAQSRFWALYSTAGAVVLSLFLAFPSLENVRIESGRLRAVENQIHDLTSPMASGPKSSDRAVAFRLTVPLFARATGLNWKGTLALQALSGVLLLLGVLKVAERATNDRVIALLSQLAVATVWAGSTGFLELRGMYDAVALCLLLVGCWLRNPIGIAVTVFAAGWTDERALLAAGFILLWHGVMDRRWLQPRTLAPVFALLAYAVTRWWVQTRLGLAPGEGGIGLQLLLSQVNNGPIGLWSACEGLWLLVVLAGAVLLNESRWSLLAAYTGLILVIALGAVAVVDITRGMAFIVPVLPVALAILAREMEPRALRLTALVATLICIGWPAYYVGGKSTIWLNYPLPIQIVRWFTGQV